jgi:outer membrane receptor protein involved in Fe transport
MIFGLMTAVFLSGRAAAQGMGTVSGRVIDAASGEPIIGVNVVISEQKKVAATDLNGRYALSGVPAGQHVVVFQMMGYGRSSSQVTVAAGAVSNLNVSLSYQTTDEVVVTAKRISNTEASLLSARKKAAVAQDAISSEQISKTPDSNAADAAKRVVGITMDRNNKIIIRGMAERYSSTMLSDTVLPSTDPDSRVAPIDIFPVALLDNLVVIKAYTPDLPGDFCGGVVKINPKDYPEDLLARLSLGVTFDLNTVGKGFWTYKGGAWDWFGVDDGTRKMPEELNKWGVDKVTLNYAGVPDIVRYKVGTSVQNVYTPYQIKGFPSGKFDVTVGDSFKIKDKYTIGFIFSGVFGETCKTIKTSYYKPYGNLAPEKLYNIENSQYNTNKGVLFSLGFSSVEHKIRATVFYNHKSKNSTDVSVGYNADRQNSTTGIDIAKNYELKFVSSGLLFTQMTGEHIFPSIDTTIEWSGSYSRADQDEPDVRQIQLTDAADAGTPGIYELYRSNDSRRYWLEHGDWVGEGSLAVSYKFKQWTGIYSKFKMGGGLHVRERESSKRTFQWQNDGSVGWNNPRERIEWYFGWPFIMGTTSPADPYHYYLQEITTSGDKYSGNLNVINGFGQLDIPLIKQLRLVGGYRYEYSSMNLKTFDTTYLADRDLYAEPLKKNNHLAGVSLTASPTDDINIRAAFSKTLGRPDFRELSPTVYSLLSKEVYIKGNKYLKQTDIYNYDFRFEWFPSALEIVAVSAFYKYLIKPVEMLETAGTTSTTFYTYRNARYAKNVGIELELRKNLAFGGSDKTKKILKQFLVSANAAYIWSVIKLKYTNDIKPGDIDPLKLGSVLSNLTDLTIYTSRNRPLQGQSPWMVNCGFEYDNNDVGFNASIVYNINGRRILRVGTFKSGIFFGDVYEESYSKLDLVLKQRILEYGDIKITFSNLIDPAVTITQEITNPALLIYKKKITTESYRLGRSIGMSYSYKF